MVTGAWASSLVLVSSIPTLSSLASLDLRGDRSTRMTSGTERVTTSSEPKAAACVQSPKAGRVKFLWDARGRPQLRSCHARPCGQAPTNHRGAYTNSSQSAPVLFPSPARSSPGSPEPRPGAGIRGCRCSRLRSRLRQPGSWLPSLSPVAFTEDESPRGRAPSQRRPPAHLHLATGEGGGDGVLPARRGGAGLGEGTRGRVASSLAPRGTAGWPGSAAPPPPPANEWPGPTKCYVSLPPDTPSSDVASLVPRAGWRHFPWSPS